LFKGNAVVAKSSLGLQLLLFGYIRKFSLLLINLRKEMNYDDKKENDTSFVVEGVLCIAIN
jgi:hypothetical protein